jgi:hypothetical protein
MSNKVVIALELVNNPQYAWKMEVENFTFEQTKIRIIGARGSLEAAFLVDAHELKNKVSQLRIALAVEDDPDYKDKLTPEVISEVTRRFSQRSFEDMSQELHQLIDDVLDDMKSDHIISGKNTPCHEIGKLEDGSPDPCYDCAVIDDKGICQQCRDYNKYVKKVGK